MSVLLKVRPSRDEREESESVIRSAATTMRVSRSDIEQALRNLRGPVTRDESIVMACAQAIVWALKTPQKGRDK